MIDETNYRKKLVTTMNKTMENVNNVTQMWLQKKNNDDNIYHNSVEEKRANNCIEKELAINEPW